MLCHYHLLVCLSCFVANCWSSTSEYLIIRHGRSRVRHSSEKDHIRWGLQVFDNFTLLDYDTVDDSNETSSTSSNLVELRPPKKPGRGRVGVDQFSDNNNNSDTLTIQFSESEELDRMIDISDFDSISIESGGSGSSGRKQSSSFSSWRNNHTLNLPFAIDPVQRLTSTPLGQGLKGSPLRKKLIKKEIMENIRKTVDKGLEYLKSHKNLDEVKIELKPFRARTKGGKNGERLPHSFGTTSIDPDMLLRKVIPSHEWSNEREKNEPKHVDGNRKDYTQVSSPFSNPSTGTIADSQRQSAESELPSSAYLAERYWKSVKINNDGSFFRSSTVSPERKQISTETTGSPDNNDYPNDSPPQAVDDLRDGFASPVTANDAGSLDWSEKKIDPIKSKTNSGNNAEENFNYELQKQPFDLRSTVTFRNDGPPVEESDEVINILNDSPTMSFEPNEADAPSTIIFNSDSESDQEDPLTWVSDASDSTDAGSGNVPDMGEIFRTEDIDLSELDETSRNNRRNLMKGRDVVTKFLQIVESQHLLGSNCTAGTALNLGEGVVDRYAQDRFRVEAEIAVNRANMLTRIFKFASPEVQASEHLLHASVLSMVEFDDDIFAAGNCFDWNQHTAKKGLFCPFAYRLPPPDQGASLAKDLAAEYHYLGNTSEWFFLARKNAEKVIRENEQYIKCWYRGEKRWLHYSSPRTWLKPRNHEADCFFCAVQVGHGKAITIYPDLPSSAAPKLRETGLENPIRKLPEAVLSSSTLESESVPSVAVSEYRIAEVRSPHYPNQKEIDDLVRDLSLTKANAELLISRLKEWELLDGDVKITTQRKRHEPYSSFFTYKDGLCFCHDVGGLFDEMGLKHEPKEWRLFIDSSSKSLKAVLLHNGNEHPSIPVAHSKLLKENYDSTKLLMDSLHYSKYCWEVIGDFKMIAFLMGLQAFHIYTNNTVRQSDEILSVKYEDGRWSKPYYDCGGGNIWMLTYTVPFFGYENGSYFFKGTSGIDIDLRRVDIDQCPQKSSPSGAPQPLNIFAGTDKCKPRTTECAPIPGLGFRRGSYRCVCRKGYYFPDTSIEQKWFNGTTLEEEYEKLMQKEYSTYHDASSYQCLPCAEGCDSCLDASPCVAALNWTMRTGILVLACAVIGLLPPAAVFTFRYQQVKVVRAASPALLRVIALGAFCIYCTSIVMYPPPSLYTCTARVWLREIGFSLTYGALMLKTWRISVIFRVRSAKAVKITDAYLLKRLGLLCGFVGIALLVRTLVAPPVVIVGRTADNLKAFLCKTDWWDHTFTSMEVLFLAWGVRLCIMVRKAPSEFNESRFISMAIYNEFLLTCFLNVSMLFLQSPANPDLLYIIFFCHTQLTVTLLLGLIFGSKVYLVFRGGGKHQDDSTGLGIKPSGAKFISRTHGRTFANASSVTTSTAQLGGNIANEGRLTEEEASEEIKRLHIQLQLLYDRIPQRGVAIATIAYLIDICKNSSLKPPPPLGPAKAIMAAPDSGQTHVDKGTNTNTIPNGTYGSEGWVGSALHQSQARITITDDSDHNNRSIDNSNFNLNNLQLKCMCSEEEVVEDEQEPKCECHRGGMVYSCSKSVNSFKHSDCCDSGREGTRAVLVKRNSDHMLSSSGCCGGDGQHGSGNQQANICSSKFSELSAKNFESCDNLLHQQHKQRQKQISCGDSIDNHSSRQPNPRGGYGLVTTTSSLSVDEKNFRILNQENFNKLYASHNNKIDSLKENFLMRNALTTALHNLENENRSRNHRMNAESFQFPSTVGNQRISPTCPSQPTTITTTTNYHNTSTTSTPTPSCSSSGASITTTNASSGGMMSTVPVSVISGTGADAATATAAATADTNGTGSSGQSKKKKSPDKRLVIDLNDRSKYTEEVSV